MSTIKLSTFALAVGLAMTGSVLAQGARTDFGKRSGQVQSCERDEKDGECVAENKPAARGGKQAPVEIKYPNAKRVEPAKIGSKLGKLWISLVNASNKGDDPEQTFAAAEAVIASDKANAYERSAAARIAAYSWVERDDYGQAMAYFQKALDYNGLDNNTHYDTMFALAQLQITEEQYDQSLATIERYIQETGTADVKALTLRGNSYYRTERYAQAIPDLQKAVEMDTKGDKNLMQLLLSAYSEADMPLEAVKFGETMLAKNPNDKNLQLNIANLYIQIDKPEKAAAVFDGMKARGMFTESKDYENGYRLLANIPGREKDAAKMITEGLDKGLLQPSESLYNYLAQTYYFDEQIAQAIDAWKKALPLAKDGESALNLAKVLSQEGQDAESKRYAESALVKGVKKKGEAYIVIARAEGNLGNKPGMIAAYREAAKYPETRDTASKMLKQAGVK